MAWIVIDKNKDIIVFNSLDKPQKYKKPIMVRADYVEEDYHGHFFHPDIPTGEYKEIWAVREVDERTSIVSYYEGHKVKHPEYFSNIIRNRSYKDEPLEI